MSKANVQRIPEELLAGYWYSFMHDLLAEVRSAYLKAHVEEGLTQQDIAKRLGRDPAFISRCVRGQQNMTVRTMNNIARAVGCRLNVSLESLNQLAAANKQISQYSSASNVLVFAESFTTVFQGDILPVFPEGIVMGPVTSGINSASSGINLSFPAPEKPQVVAIPDVQ